MTKIRRGNCENKSFCEQKCSKNCLDYIPKVISEREYRREKLNDVDYIAELRRAERAVLDY